MQPRISWLTPVFTRDESRVSIGRTGAGQCVTQSRKNVGYFAFILMLVSVLLAGLPLVAVAAPQAQLWEFWKVQNENENQNNDAVIDHGAFTDFLGKYLVADDEQGLNRVRYGDVSDADRKALSDYVDKLEAIGIRAYSRAQQHAYWINLYNAATLDIVLEHYPVDSIRDIGGGLFSGGPWDEKLLEVEGKKLTLNDIEHRILRPIWPGPLTHYAVNCASVGCPNLRREAYTAENLQAQLRANARAYVNSPRGLTFDDGRLKLSKIYKWYAVDFGGSPTAIISHLRQFAEPALSARLDAADGIDGYYYDWSLNDTQAQD